MTGDVIDTSGIVKEVGDVALGFINRFWPDKTEQEKKAMANELAMSLGQLDINKQEANSKFWFVAAARPALIWAGGFSLFYKTVIFPTLVYFGHPGPDIDVTVWMPILLSLIGARTFEKFKSIQGNH